MASMVADAENFDVETDLSRFFFLFLKKLNIFVKEMWKGETIKVEFFGPATRDTGRLDDLVADRSK